MTLQFPGNPQAMLTWEVVRQFSHFLLPSKSNSPASSSALWQTSSCGYLSFSFPGKGSPPSQEILQTLVSQPAFLFSVDPFSHTPLYNILISQLQLPVPRNTFYAEPSSSHPWQDLTRIPYQASHSYHTLLRGREQQKSMNGNLPNEDKTRHQLLEL